MRDVLAQDKTVELAGDDGAKLDKDAGANERKALAAKLGVSALISWARSRSPAASRGSACKW